MDDLGQHWPSPYSGEAFLSPSSTQYTYPRPSLTCPTTPTLTQHHNPQNLYQDAYRGYQHGVYINQHATYHQDMFNIPYPPSLHHQNGSQQASQALAPNSPPRQQILQPINNASDIPASTFKAATNDKENTLPKAAVSSKRKPKKPKGPGLKSGTNRHKDRASDDEISTLSKVQKEMAELKPTSIVVKETEQKEELERLVDQAEYLLGYDSHTTPTQVHNYMLNQAWDKYKACKEWEEHMGGGDGDADHEVGENDDEEALDKKKPRPKQKKGALPGNYSLKVLQAFKEFKVYELLDAWAQGDDTVIQTFDCNSAEDILELTDIEDDEQFKTPAKK
ncbi:hypothetical protein ARMGADRAFT_1091978 [Armillaria gallica]|uniref:Uncharacterized protein n=1 Tax=Armillaria gallica TaxID=47427 RepID=A0A2H3CC99_ARMGA|nr:hypothetical protein ARMGADRAFT_1091978 [Armillaria gallica]